MSNPWLDVPLSEYEEHMSSDNIRQLSLLSGLFAETIGRCRPSSVAILGIAGGNGLDCVNSDITFRIVGLDVNPLYLEAVRQRYSRFIGLELYCIDLSTQHVELRPVQLVHAALIFEHAGVDNCLENAISMVAPDGHLSIVLQLPGAKDEIVSASPFASVQNLKSHFSLVSAVEISRRLTECGFELTYQTTRGRPGGKNFWMGIFSRSERHL